MTERSAEIEQPKVSEMDKPAFSDVFYNLGGKQYRIANLLNETISRAFTLIPEWEFSLHRSRFQTNYHYLDKYGIEAVVSEKDRKGLPDSLLKLTGTVFATFTCPPEHLRDYGHPELYQVLQVGLPYDYKLVTDGTLQNTRLVSCDRTENNPEDLNCPYEDFMCDDYNCVFVNNYEFRLLIEDWLNPASNYFHIDNMTDNYCQNPIEDAVKQTVPYNIDSHVENNLPLFLLNDMTGKYLAEYLKSLRQAWEDTDRILKEWARNGKTKRKTLS